MQFIDLAAQRARISDKIDHAVGLTNLAGKASGVDKSQPLAVVHARNEEGFERAQKIIRAAYKIGKPKRAMPCVIERIGK